MGSVNQSRLFYAILTLIVALAGTHIFFISQIPDIPYWDEWDFIAEGDMLVTPDYWKMLWVPHGEHVHATARMVIRAMYDLGVLKFNYLMLVSFAIFCGYTFCLYHLLKHLGLSPIWSLVSLVPFFSTIGLESFTMGQQICNPLFMIFFILSLLAFLKLPSFGGRVLHAIFVFLSVVSSAAGTGYAIGAMLYSCFLMIGLIKNQKHQETLKNVFTIFSMIAIVYLAFFFKRYHSAPFGFDPIKLFVHYTHIVSLGFMQANSKPIFVYLPIDLLLIAGYLALVFASFRYRYRDNLLLWVFFIGSVLIALAGISAGRHFLPIGQGKSERYAEISMLLIPSTIYLIQIWWDKLKAYKKHLVFLTLILACDDFHFDYYIGDYIIKRSRGVECLRSAVRENRPIDCIDLFPSNLDDEYKYLQDKNLDFMKF
jgi:hypothetical protein